MILGVFRPLKAGINISAKMLFTLALIISAKNQVQWKLSYITTHIGMELPIGSKNVPEKNFLLAYKFLYGHYYNKFLKTYSDA